MRKFLFNICLLLALAGCARVVPETSPKQEKPAVESPFVKGVLDVRFSPEFAAVLEQGVEGAVTKSPDLNSALESIGAVAVRRLFPYDEKWDVRHRREGLDRWYKVYYDPDSTDPTRATKALGALQGAEIVEAPRSRRLAASVPLPFNDPMALKYQWNYCNDGSLHSGFVSGADINVVPVWNRYTAGSPDVLVAVVDGGIDISHPDLGPVTVPAGEDGSKNFCETSYGSRSSSLIDPYTIYPYDHGTHVAGTIGAVNNNGKYVCGIAGGSDGTGGVRLLSCQVFMYDASTTASEDEDVLKEYYGDTAEALVWACDRGAVIANNSWGYVYDTESEAASGRIDSADKAAVDYFIKYAGCDNDGNQLDGSPMKGGVVVFAAGNEGMKYGAPANYEPIIAVGAIAANGKRASYSNYGDWVDICAPGGDAQSDWCETIYSTAPMDEQYVWTGGGYCTEYDGMQGTSMAAPHVSGVCALLASYFGGPGFTPADLKKKLFEGVNTSFPTGTGGNIGNLVSAWGAFTSGANRPPEVVKSPDPVLIDNLDVEMKMRPSDFITDPDGETLEWTVAVTSDILGAEVSEGYLVLTGVGCGYAEVTLTGTDAAGESAQVRFQVLVRDSSYNSANGVESDPFDLYPNPVVDLLHIRPDRVATFEVRITNSTGRTLLEQTMSGSAFNPPTVDMRACATGLYFAEITYDGRVYDYSFAKQ